MSTRSNMRAGAATASELIGSIFQTSHVAIGVTRLIDNTFVDVNDAFLTLFELKRSDIIGHTALELGLWADPAARMALVERLRHERSVSDFEAEQRTRSGRLRQVLVSANLAEHGGENYLVGLITDITDRRVADSALRESEERLALALQGSNLGWWDYDLATRRVRIDLRSCAMLGWSETKRVYSADEWRPHVHPADLPRLQHDFASHSRGDTPAIDIEYRLRHADGHWVWVQMRGRTSERDDQRQPVRIVGTALDVSAQRRLGDDGPGLLQRIEALIHEARAGSATIDETTDQRVIESLSRRQRQILGMVAQGCTSAQIASQLHIAKGTAISHRRALMEKLGLHRASEVTRFAIEHKLDR